MADEGGLHSDEAIAECGALIGHVFADPSLLRLALVHRSWEAEHDTGGNNERLEFLGDAVLGLLVAELAFEMLADEPEGRLSELRRAVVNSAALAEVARSLGIGEWLMLGRGEDQAGGRDKPSILADALEAIVGAVHLDGGSSASRAFVRRLFVPVLEAAIPNLHMFDSKTALKEICERKGAGNPRYESHASGPDHARIFDVVVHVSGAVRGRGRGRTKKAAEQAAAAEAVAALSADDRD